MEKRERDIESWLRDKIQQMGGVAMKFTSPGNDGVPDRIAILPGGQVWFIELKTTGEKPGQSRSGRSSASGNWAAMWQ